MRLISGAGAAVALLPVPDVGSLHPDAHPGILVDIEILSPDRLVRYLSRRLDSSIPALLAKAFMQAAIDSLPEQSVATVDDQEAGFAVGFVESTPLTVTLDLAEGTRLIEIALTPYAHSCNDYAGAFVMHRMRFNDADVPPSEATGILAAYLPAAVMTLSGFEPDGSPWGAVLQMQEVSGSAVPGEGATPFPFQLMETGTLAIDRACDLTGIHRQPLMHISTESDLTERFEADGANTNGWSAVNLLAGLAIGMASATDYSTLVDLVDANQIPHGDRTEYVGARLHDLLRGWAATYEGPGA